MSFPPLIERELRVALRKKRPARRRFVAASACVAGALVCLLIAWLVPGGGIGHWLHQAFCLVGFWMVLRTPPAISGAFADERASQTLGLLWLSGLSAPEVFLSKALSSALVAWTDLLALFPMLALPFLIGGVSSDLFLATVFTLPTVLIFVLAVTLLASIWSADEGAAVVLASVVGLAICTLPLAVYFGQAHFSRNPPSGWWLRLSPAYAPWLVWRGQAPRPEVWANLGLTLVWSALCLGLAGAGMQRLWRECEAGARDSAWNGWWCRLVHGTPARRRRLAADWLAVNPFTWLAARDQQPAFLAWAVVGGVTVIWLLCWAVWGARWPSVPNILLTVTLLNSTLHWLILHAAAGQLAEARRDGTFELVLTTPLATVEVVWGGLEALKWQFQTVGRCVLALDAVFLTGGLATRTWNPASGFVYGVAASFLLAWAWSQTRGWRQNLSATWAGLNSCRPVYAVGRLSGFLSWTSLWQLFWLRDAFSKFPSFPSGNFIEIALACVALGVAALVLAFRRSQNREGCTMADHMERRLVRELREIAREPVPDRDHPGFKTWDVRDRFPWGWSHVQEQLHERLARRLSL